MMESGGSDRHTKDEGDAEMPSSCGVAWYVFSLFSSVADHQRLHTAAHPDYYGLH